MAQNHLEENNYPKALAISTLLMGAFIALSFFWLIGKFEPNDELGMGGMVVNYGTSVTGMGTDYTSIEEPSTAPNANGKVPDQITPVPATKNVSSELSDKNLTTQDNEEAVSVNTKATNSVSNPSTTQDNKPSAPAINQNAIYKGKANNATGGGDGTGTEAGNQGDIDGDPLTPFYGDGGSGFGNRPLPLSNFRNLVAPVDDGQETGTIMVKIQVNKSGRIVSAVAGRGSTFSNLALARKCENAMLNASLNPITKGPEIRIFYVPFVFKVK